MTGEDRTVGSFADVWGLTLEPAALSEDGTKLTIWRTDSLCAQVTGCYARSLHLVRTDIAGYDVVLASPVYESLPDAISFSPDGSRLATSVPTVKGTKTYIMAVP